MVVFRILLKRTDHALNKYTVQRRVLLTWGWEGCGKDAPHPSQGSLSSSDVCNTAAAWRRQEGCAERKSKGWSIRKGVAWENSRTRRKTKHCVMDLVWSAMCLPRRQLILLLQVNHAHCQHGCHKQKHGCRSDFSKIFIELHKKNNPATTTKIPEL